MLSSYSIGHSTPEVIFGDVSRPLIYPHAIPQHLRSQWPAQREVVVSFAGLTTEKRAARIEQWLTDSKQFLPPTDMTSPFERILRFPRPWPFWNKNLANGYSSQGAVQLIHSRRGRSWPGKGWDPGYFDRMLKSQFVLCPDGDFVWTYRFFEAILCGAVPIVENSCQLYDGYIYYSMKDSLASVRVDDEVREYNYRRCVEHLTVDIPLLESEIMRNSGRN